MLNMTFLKQVLCFFLPKNNQKVVIPSVCAKSKLLSMTVLKRYLCFILRKYNKKDKKDQLLDRISVVFLSIVPFCLFKILKDEEGNKIYALVGDKEATHKVRQLISQEPNNDILVLSKMWRVKEHVDVKILTKPDDYENMLLKYNKFHLLFCAYTENTGEESYFLPYSFPKLKQRFKTTKIYMLNESGTTEEHTEKERKTKLNLENNEKIQALFDGCKAEFIPVDHTWIKNKLEKELFALLLLILVAVQKVVRTK